MREVGVPAVGQVLGGEPVQQRLAVGFALRPRLELRLPFLVRFPAPVDQLAGVGDDLVAHLELLVGIEAQDFLDGRDLVVAQGRAVRLAGVHQVGRGIADDRAQFDERRPVGDGLGVGDGLLDGRHVLAALHLLHVPAVGLVARGGVLAQRDVGVVLDRDLVVVVEDDEVAQLLHGRQRRGLRRHALFDVAVGGDHVDEVVEGTGARLGVRIEQAALVARRHGHAHRGGQALAQRPGGDLDAEGVPELRVPGRLGAPGAQRLDVGELEAEPAEVELEVQRQAAVSAREDEPVAAQPVGVAGVVPHHALEQGVGQRRQAHRRPGMPVADLLHRVGCQHPDRVDGRGVYLGPVVGQVRLGQRGDLFECGHRLESLGHRAGSIPTLVRERRLMQCRLSGTHGGRV